jgi:microcompartment protein CcmL/EutN
MASKDNLQYALGMIETKGLIGAIEAADAACKAAQVKLVSREKVTGALINIKFVGEVAAVQTAVDAGAAAAQKVGQLMAAHVIPNPVEDLEPYIFDLLKTSKEPVLEKRIELPAETIEIQSGKDDEEIISDYAGDEIPKEIVSKDDAIKIDEPDQISMIYSEFEGSDDELLSELEDLTVHELRKMARGVDGLSIFGREISKANKDTLIDEIMKAHHAKK